MWSGVFLIDLRKIFLPRNLVVGGKCDGEGLGVLFLFVLLLILGGTTCIVVVADIRFGTYQDIFPNPKP